MLPLTVDVERYRQREGLVQAHLRPKPKMVHDNVPNTQLQDPKIGLLAIARRIRVP
jgi:hypothetical protein